VLNTFRTSAMLAGFSVTNVIVPRLLPRVADTARGRGLPITSRRTDCAG
jgi:hypothetical protein